MFPCVAYGMLMNNIAYTTQINLEPSKKPDPTRVKLTKAYIEKVPPAAGKYDHFHWDTELKGFGLRVTPKTRTSPKGKKTFIFQGRVGGIKSRRITIGPFPNYTVEQARGRATKLLVNMRDGIDPIAVAKNQAALRVTLREVADAYMSRPGKLKESSKNEVERHLTTTFEAWQDRSIVSITEDECRKRYRYILTKGLRGDRENGAPAQANQAFSILRALINFASRQYKRVDGTPLILHNPVTALKDDWVQLRPKTSRIPDSKVGAVWSFMQQARVNAHNRDTRASIDLVIFLMLTGARIGEASSLEWKNVNLLESWWHIEDPKNSRKIWLPLSDQAVELLKARQDLPESVSSPYVFTSWSGHIKDPRDTMKRLSAVAGEHLSAHDLRRTFTHIGIRVCGIEVSRIERLTNHVARGVTAIHYDNDPHLQYLKPEVQRIADWMAGG
jgi:integrase